MKLTSREKILLIIMGFVAFAVLSYFFMVKPQLEKMGRLVVEREKIRLEVQKVKAEISPDNKIHKDYEELYTKIGDKTLRFYPVILQDKLIVTLNSLIEKTSVKSDSAGFSVAGINSVALPAQVPEQTLPAEVIVTEFKKLNGETPAVQAEANTTPQPQATTQTKPASAEQALNQVKSMAVTLKYSASYEQLMQLIKGLEAMNRTVVIKSMDMANDGEKLSGSMIIEFYAFPKIHDQDADYLSWTYNNSYGKANPFK